MLVTSSTACEGFNNQDRNRLKIIPMANVAEVGIRKSESIIINKGGKRAHGEIAKLVSKKVIRSAPALLIVVVDMFVPRE